MRIDVILFVAALRTEQDDQGPLSPTASCAPADPLARQQAYLEHFSKNAMACQFAILLNLQQYPASGSAAMQAFALIDRLEAQLTTYRNDSEISVLNSSASEQWLRVEPGLFGLLVVAKQIFDDTGGAFDITSGVLSELWGFSRRQGRVPSESAIAGTLPKVSNHLIQFSDDGCVKLMGGASVNLGGIGKGYALDRAVGLLQELGIHDFVIHGGQSSVIARGNQLTADESEPGRGWTIGLSHPTQPETRLAEIHLRNEALGTSGTGRQGFFHQGRRYGHIIDPRTGWPTDHCLSSTVISDDATKCDALATAFFVMQRNDVEKYCKMHPNVKAILVLPGDKPGKITIESFNLTSDDWTLL